MYTWQNVETPASTYGDLMKILDQAIADGLQSANHKENLSLRFRIEDKKCPTCCHETKRYIDDEIYYMFFKA